MMNLNFFGGILLYWNKEKHELNNTYAKGTFKKFLCVPKKNFMLCFIGRKRGLPWGASGKEPTCQRWRPKRCSFEPWVGRILWRRAWQFTQVYLSGESMDRGAWQATVHRVAESDTTKST